MGSPIGYRFGSDSVWLPFDSSGNQNLRVRLRPTTAIYSGAFPVLHTLPYPRFLSERGMADVERTLPHELMPRRFVPNGAACSPFGKVLILNEQYPVQQVAT